MKRFLLMSLCLVAFSFGSSAQRWAVGTNLLDYANFGTLNVEGSISFARHWTAQANVRYNDWSYNKADPSTQLQNRQQSYAFGARLWPWNVYSGWWFGSQAQYQEYNRGGIVSKKTEEGDAFGIGVSAGYTYMLHKYLNIEFGLGAWGGMTAYTTYACPRCGQITDSGTKVFFLPNDAFISLMFIF
jgi:hypothetical protein